MEKILKQASIIKHYEDNRREIFYGPEDRLIHYNTYIELSTAEIDGYKMGVNSSYEKYDIIIYTLDEWFEENSLGKN